MADRWLETSPTFSMVGVVIGFAAFVNRLVRMRTLFEPEGEEEDPAADDE